MESYPVNQSKKGLAVGIDRIASFASTEDHPIHNLVKNYHKIWHELDNPNLDPEKKLMLVRELFITLGHFHAYGFEKWQDPKDIAKDKEIFYDKNFQLDVFVEATKFYHWAIKAVDKEGKIKNINNHDKQFLRQNLNEHQSDVNLQLLNTALQTPLTPELLVNIADALYAATQTKQLDPNPSMNRPGPESLSKLKSKKAKPNLAKKLAQLEQLIAHADIESTKISRSRYRHGRESMHRFTGSVPTSPNDRRPVSPSFDSKKNVTSPVTSPEFNRKNQVSPPSYPRHSVIFGQSGEHGGMTDSLVDLAKKELANMYDKNNSPHNSPHSFAHDYTDSEIAAKHVELFKTYDKIIKLAFAVLNDPEFQSLEKKTKNKLTQKLLQIVVDCAKLTTSMIDVRNDSTVKDALQKKIACLHLAHEIHEKIDSNEKFNFYAVSFKYLGESDPSQEEAAFVNALELQFDETTQTYQNDKYTLKVLGEGNDRVYLITDKNGAKVILRGRNVYSTEMEHGAAPDQMRFRTCGSLGIDGYATQIYEFAPGGKVDEEGRSVYRNYEISEAVSGGNLEKCFKDLHKGLEDRTISIVDFQVKLLENSSKLIKLICHLKEVGICWPDLKPSNILIDENGDLTLSDIKTWVDSSPWIRTPEGKLIYKGEAFLLTPGYTTVKTTDFKKGEGNIYDIDRLQKETVAFTLYQMITGVFALEQKPTYCDDRDEFIKLNFPRQMAQLEKMLKKVEEDNSLSGPPLGKYIAELARYVHDLVANDHSSLESILAMFDSEGFQKALQQAKAKPKSDNNNDTVFRIAN